MVHSEQNRIKLKILALSSALDLKYRLGCTPAWWQLFKSLYETGNEIIVTPYLGDPVQSLWWRTYPNPCSWESKTYNSYLDKRKKSGISPSKRGIFSPGFDYLVSRYIKPKWKKHIIDILNQEGNVNAVLVMNVPMNHITGIPSQIKREFGIPVVYYDGDLPTSLPKYTVSRGFKFNYYVGADLSEYDAIIGNSEGCLNDLMEMGAKMTFPFQYGIDPQLAAPIKVEKDIDVSFFGYGSDFREEWMTKLITIPSQMRPDIKFAVAGGGFKIDLGNAELLGDLSYSEWRQFCGRSKISLNITRWSHTNVYASSTSRPFELAAFGACIVSQPYDGIEKWFEIGRDLVVVRNSEQVMVAYEQLLEDDNRRDQMGNNAREKILAKHTFTHRAKELVDIISKLQSLAK
jgi:glycosyltransferase involved in cell wall biosynthesis